MKNIIRENERVTLTANPKIVGNLPTRLYNIGVGIAFLALAGWLAWRLLDGTLSYYLHPRFNLLIALTSLVLSFLGGWVIWWQLISSSNHHIAGLKVVLPVVLIALIGLITVPRPLSNLGNAATGELANTSINQTMTDVIQKQDWNNPANLNTTNWNLLDWSAALNNPQRAALLVGSPVDLTGFVIQPANKTGRSFMLARYVVVCCTADSTTLRLPVVTAKNMDLEDGEWVHLRGSVIQGANGNIGFSATTLEQVSQPSQPYIYP